MTNFGTSTCDWQVRLCEETLTSHEKCKEICVNSESNDDDPEKDARTLKFSTIPAAVQVADDLTQFAQNSLDKQLFISLHSVFRLLKERIQCLQLEIKTTF